MEDEGNPPALSKKGWEFDLQMMLQSSSQREIPLGLDISRVRVGLGKWMTDKS